MNTDGYRRSGYTILELMISLVLLATLTLVAWSILGSYRDAEQRGWNQSYQMQVIRISRDWLETDAACLMEPRVPSQWKPFVGDEQGFEVDVIPSMNPLAWLEQVTQAAEPLTTTTRAWTEETQNTAIAMDPHAVHRLRYRIVARTQATAAQGSGLDTDRFDVQRELIPSDRWSKASPSAASEKLLTTEDLYRITDEESPDESAATAKNATASIRNLVAPRFRYSDGKEWQSQWDSQLKGGLPRAIELSFDLPAASTADESDAPDTTEVDEFVAEDFAGSTLSMEPGVVADVPTSTTDDNDTLARDVRIVVLVAGSTVEGVPHE